VGDARKPSHQPIIETELPFFAQHEDQRSGEGLRDAVRKERRFLLRFWDPGCVRCSSGSLDDGRGIRAYHEGVKSSPSTPWPFQRFAAETFDKGLWFEPGQGWAYSNPGYMLLKRVAEEVTGTSYRALISERIARRLGLQRTFVAESIDDLAALAPGTSSAL